MQYPFFSIIEATFATIVFDKRVHISDVYL